MKCPIKKYEPGDFELDKHYCEIANERVQKAMQDKAVGE